ncbi:TPA: tRNA preQ1(34) S-adenosylmethionine ribosyltransferase-isomerase QueA [Candidatus Poribacteria bacterium]|nr:tRNA preQ1(34) S-adenosylmethionine ribosyltransferase-isomerase QueA [Candidatus Poribacteria bacterium]
MKISLFDYDLPEELIAQFPLPKRDESRLMVLDRRTETISHHIFSQLPDFLNNGDLLVMNNTKVIPARLIGKKEKTGGNVEILLLSVMANGLWKALVKHSSRIKYGSKVIFGDGRLTARILDKTESQERLIKFETDGDPKKLIEELGKPPLPPYIKREIEPEDKERYQTIYAKEEGAVAAPTAGLHFTEAVFENLKVKGIDRVEITLHVGLGTFQPVKTENVEDHIIHEEIFSIPSEVAKRINETRSKGGKIVAVGTTTVRALESSIDANGEIIPRSGATNIYIYPGFKFRAVDAMITNFHLPKSTLIMLVCAFAGRDFVMRAYHSAIKEKYRFYSYGDAMLIL